MAQTREDNLTLAGTATLTVPLFTVENDGVSLQAADYCASGATDGAKTAQIVNNTTSVNLTAALTINGIAALAKTPFVLATTNAPAKKGDQLVVVYTVNTAGSVGPGEVSISSIWDDQRWTNRGSIAWAG